MAINLPIALQLYTVRDVLSKDLDAGLAQVRAIGYTHVEMAGHYNRTPAEVKALLDKHRLTPIAGHDMWLVSATPASAAANAKALGYQYAIMPWFPEDRRSVAGYSEVVATAKQANAEHAGVTFGYHNHDFEFKPVEDGGSGFAVLFEGTDLTCEMDTCWVAVGGADPVQWMQKLAGRVPLLHIKDCRDFAAKALCEVGTGKVPVKDIVQAAPGVGAKFLVVEQDNNWIDGDPMKSAKISYDNLRKITG